MTQSTRKNSLPICSFFAANAISLVGNIAIPWFVLPTTGSSTQTGITGFFNVLVVTLAGFLGGALAVRLGCKRTSIISDLASGVTVALIPLLYFTIGLEFWQLMVLVFLGAYLDTPGSTARSALIPELAEKRNWFQADSRRALRNPRAASERLRPGGKLRVLPADWLQIVSEPDS